MYSLTAVFMAHKEQCASDKADQKHDHRDAQVDPGALKDHLRIGWLPGIKECAREVDDIAQGRKDGDDIQVPGQIFERDKDSC